MLGIALVAALFIAGISTWSQRAVRRTLEEHLRSELRTALEANVTALELWVQGQFRTASLVTSDPEVRDPALLLLTNSAANAAPVGGPRSGGPGMGGGPFQRTPQQETFAQALDEKLRVLGHQAAVLVSTNGRVLAASSRMRLRSGSTVPADHQEAFQRVLSSGKPALVTPFKPARPTGRFGRGPGPRGPGAGTETGDGPSRPPRPSVPGGGDRPETPARTNSPGPGAVQPPPGELQVMQVLAPFRDEAGTVIGVLAFVLRPEAEFTRVLSVARPGTSGETFAFDSEGRLLSQSRFDEQLRKIGLLTNAPGASSALNLVLRDPGHDLTHGTGQPAATNRLMRLVADAQSSPGGVLVEPVRDYRGVPVVGAWHWLDEHQFGVVTKIDAAEAFEPLRVLALISRILLLLVALATLVGLVGSHVGTVWRRRFDEAQLRARQLGQYTLVERIGEGAMGVVYRAHHALLRRETAVKLLLPDRADEELIGQFEHEVQLTCRLTHPNTVQIFDYGHTADGIFYYVMELLQGLTLQELVERHGAQPQERVLHLLRQAAGSLAEAHDSGLIHRDIKPGNLFLCERGGVPDTLKVLDFGLVRDLRHDPESESDRDALRRFLGTPLYMAPEMIRTPGHGSPASDLYALGAVAYLLVTGHPVFEAESLDDMWEKHANAIPVPPGQHPGVDIAAELEALILRCLAKDPADRPASMHQFIELIDRCPSPRPWTLERRRAWWRRHFETLASRIPARPVAELEATLPIDITDR